MKLDWYREGLAEALVGSVGGKAILPRRKLVQALAAKGEFRTPAQIVRTTYVGHTFAAYEDAGLFVGYLIDRQSERLKAVFRAIRGNDADAVGKEFDALAADAALAADYKAYCNGLKAKVDTKPREFAEFK